MVTRATAARMWVPVEGVEVEVASHRDGASVEAGSVI